MQSISVPVHILKIGVTFSLSFEVSSQLSFPWDQNSVNPLKLAAEVNVLWFRCSQSNVVLKNKSFSASLWRKEQHCKRMLIRFLFFFFFSYIAIPRDIVQNTVQPPCATTSRTRLPPIINYPKHQNFPTQTLKVESSRKRTPLVSDRDHFVGWRF